MWPLRLSSRLAALLALTPAFAVFCVVYVGATGWTIWISFTGSRMLPSSVFVGLRQYAQLYANERWLVSVHNLVIFGVLFVAVSIALGFVLAVAIDQKVRAENLLRSVYLYPFSMSFVVTGLVWQWLLNPTYGIEKLVRGWGFEAFRFDWIVRQDAVIYTLVMAAVWHAAGLVMAIMLAGLRGIDEEIWKAARIDNKVEQEDFPSWFESLGQLPKEQQAKLGHMWREEWRIYVRDLMSDTSSNDTSLCTISSWPWIGPVK